jgi:tetratricopeptide (TPR) repeat protein
MLEIYVSSSFACAVFLLISALFPAFAGVDDEWRSLYSQAANAAAAKDYVKAEAVYTTALRKAELFGKDDQRVAATLQGLGLALRSAKKLNEAEEAIRRAAAIYAVNPGEESIEFAQAEFDLAGVLMDEGKYQPALESTKRLLPVFDRNMSPDDNRRADAICLQGDIYRMLKMYASAENLLQRCEDIRSENGEMGSAGFGEAANSLAFVYQRLGKLSDADRYFTYAEKIREKSSGLVSRELAETLDGHAALLRQMGREAEAKQKEKLAATIRAHAARN